MEKNIRKETEYVCNFNTKSVRQSVTFNHIEVPYQFHLEFKDCVTDIKDLKLMRDFLTEVINDVSNFKS